MNPAFLYHGIFNLGSYKNSVLIVMRVYESRQHVKYKLLIRFN